MGNNTNRQGPHDGVRPQLPEDTLNEHDNASIEFLSQVAQQRMTNVEERMEPSKEAIEEPPTFPDTGEGEERSGEQIEADERTFAAQAELRSEYEDVLVDRNKLLADFQRLRSELQAARADSGDHWREVAQKLGAQLHAAKEHIDSGAQSPVIWDPCNVFPVNQERYDELRKVLSAAQEQVRRYRNNLVGIRRAARKLESDHEHSSQCETSCPVEEIKKVAYSSAPLDDFEKELQEQGVEKRRLQTALDEAKGLLKAVRWIGAPVAYVENLRNEVDAFLAAQPQAGGGAK